METIAMPEPGPGQLRVRMRGAGICASELPVWEGREWFAYPREPGAPGHEGWGVVDALGPEVSAVGAGQRVAPISAHAHAEYDLVGEDAVAVLPDGVPSIFPGEPLACAVNAFARARVQAGHRVAIVGAGFQALLLAQLCAPVAGELAVISRRPQALELASAAGATCTWRAGDAGLRGQEFDVVIEATGYQEPLDLAAELVGVRGRLMIVGYHQDGLRTVDMQSWNWRGIDVVSAHERDPVRYAEGLRGAVQEVLAGRLDPTPFITHEFPLAELGQAYAMATARPEGFLKAVWRDG